MSVSDKVTALGNKYRALGKELDEQGEFELATLHHKVADEVWAIFASEVMEARR